MENKTDKNMKIKRVPVSDQVYNAIKECITSQQWKVGEKIPSENDLAEMFGVNRLTVRIALQKLNALGIVETRVGEGTFVLDFNFRKYINEVAEFTLQPEQESEIMDFRKLLEVECARLAMEKATPEELKELEKLAITCEEIGDKLNKSYKNGSLEKESYIEYAKADLDFHYQICKMSHNSIYINCFNLASELIYRYILMIMEENYNNWISNGQNVEYYYEVVKSHKDIYTYIKNKDFISCKKVYLKMIDYTEVV